MGDKNIRWYQRGRMGWENGDRKRSFSSWVWDLSIKDWVEVNKKQVETSTFYPSITRVKPIDIMMEKIEKSINVEKKQVRKEGVELDKKAVEGKKDVFLH